MRCAQQRGLLEGCEADREPVADRLVDAAGGEVLGDLRGLGRSRGAQVRSVEVGCAIQRYELARTTRATGLDTGILVLALQLDPGTTGEELERCGKVESFS